MKIARLVIGVFSFIFVLIVTFQSCAAGLVSSLSKDVRDLGGAAGIWLAVFMLAAGIIAIATKDGFGGGITAGALYIVGAAFGLFYNGIFRDLIFWSVVSLIFGGVCLVGTIAADNRKKTDMQYEAWKAAQENKDQSEHQ